MRLTKGLAGAAFALIVLQLAFWAGVVFVAVHFVRKWW